jgi:hypothetical protein
MNPSNPTPTLTLPLKGREIVMFLPLQGGGQEGDGVSVGVALNSPWCKINGTIKISAKAGMTPLRCYHKSILMFCGRPAGREKLFGVW